MSGRATVVDEVDVLATVGFWSPTALAPGPAERVAFPAERSFQLVGSSFDVLEKTSGLKRRSETIWFSSELAAAGISPLVTSVTRHTPTNNVTLHNLTYYNLTYRYSNTLS